MDEGLARFVETIQQENADKMDAIQKLQAILEKLKPSEDTYYIYSCKLVSNV
jgi:hypothetical protein